jgi:hypothetical protein
MGVSDVELCHLRNMVHRNIIINKIAKEFLFSIFIHFLFSRPSGALKFVLSNSTNRIWKN